MIYICIPTHNEQQTVGVVLWKLRQVLTDFPRDYQLLVADDASTDKTAAVLEPYTRVLPLTVIRSETRQGPAAALEMLLREAVRRSEYPKRDAIVTLQGDFSDEPDDVVPLIKRLEAGADVAVGNKVGVTKEARARRLARTLSSFFMRGQKWPEGVTVPFDGYRAYRLHGVKRAMEERGDRRLIRYDGWAGHAELLREVLPHARRVDVVDVEDRSDRLQRPRREKPFASAFQVRAMVSGKEPEGLSGVQELDRIAATASRSRERASATVQGVQSREANGAGSRDRRPGAEARREGRTRSRANGAGPDRAERRPRTPEERRARSEKAAAGGGPRKRTRSGPAEGVRRQPRTEQPSAVDDAVQPVLAAEAAGAPEPVARPKRKRRRRKRNGQATEQTGNPPTAGTEAEPPAGVTEQEVPSTAAGSESVAAPGSESAAAAGEDGRAGEKKRRRRGGRRGGRGRRKSRPEQEGASPDATADAGPVESVAAPMSEAAVRAEQDQEQRV